MADAAKLRAWYAHRQGLDGSLEGKSSAEVLLRAGWARSVGGVSPYLTLFSRAGITRDQADADAAKLHIYELPSARGCTYVLPSEDFALLPPGEALMERSKPRLSWESPKKRSTNFAMPLYPLSKKARSIPTDYAKPPAKPYATSALRVRRKDSPLRSPSRSASCRNPAISAAFPPMAASISSAINTRRGVQTLSVDSNSRRRRFIRNSRENTLPGSGQHRPLTFKRSPASA